MYINPSSNDITKQEFRDQVLTGMSLRYRNDALIYKYLFNDTKVKVPKFTYWEFDKSNFDVPDALQAKGSVPNEIYSTRKRLALDMVDRYALAVPVYDEEVELAESPIDPQHEATFLLSENMELRKEKMAYDVVMDLANVPNTAVATAWDQANSDPIKDIQNAIKEMHSNIYKKPTHIVIPFHTALSLSSNESVIERMKYTVGAQTLKMDAGMIIGHLQKWLGLTVLIPSAGMNTAAPGLDRTLSYIWNPQQVLLFYKGPLNTKGSVTFAMNFWYQQRIIWRYREELKKRTLIIAEEAFKMKKIVNEAGYIMTGVLS